MFSLNLYCMYRCNRAVQKVLRQKGDTREKIKAHNPEVQRKGHGFQVLMGGRKVKEEPKGPEMLLDCFRKDFSHSLLCDCRSKWYSELLALFPH